MKGKRELLDVILRLQKEFGYDRESEKEINMEMSDTDKRRDPPFEAEKHHHRSSHYYKHALKKEYRNYDK